MVLSTGPPQPLAVLPKGEQHLALLLFVQIVIKNCTATRSIIDLLFLQTELLQFNMITQLMTCIYTSSLFC